MARRWVWVVVGLCSACGGRAGDDGVELETGLDGEETLSFSVESNMVSRRGSDNVACFGPEQPITFGPDELGYEGCDLTRNLRLSDLRVSDTDEDGKVEPGELLQFHVSLTGVHHLYPAVSARALSAEVSPSEASNGMYAILEIEPTERLSLEFEVAADAEPGDSLTFALCATDSSGRRAPCRQVDELDFELTIE
jgi:hypothetical protein